MNSSTTDLVWEGEVPLEQVLQYVNPAYGESWDAVAWSLRNEPIENAIIDTLIDESMETGFFEEPIRIDIYQPHAKADCDDPDDHDDYCVDEGEPPRYSLGNGTHRMVAAMIAAYPNIRVTTQDPPETTEVLHVELEIEATGAQPVCNEFCEDARECFAFCTLRSFRLLPDAWAEYGIASSISGTFTLYYELGGEHREALESRIRELAVQHGITITKLTITLEKEEDF